MGPLDLKMGPIDLKKGPLGLKMGPPDLKIAPSKLLMQKVARNTLIYMLCFDRLYSAWIVKSEVGDWEIC